MSKERNKADGYREKVPIKREKNDPTSLLLTRLPFCSVSFSSFRSGQRGNSKVCRQSNNYVLLDNTVNV